MASTAREAQAGVGAAQSRGKLGGARTVAVALVDGLNVPLFLKRFDREADKDSLDLLLVIHSALDVFDELRSAGRRSSRKPYLGLLNLIDGYAVFGYTSNSLVKTIVVLDAESCGYSVPDDHIMENYLKTLYFAYVDTVSNPFFELGSALQLPSGETESTCDYEESSKHDESSSFPGPGRRPPRHPELLHGFEDLVMSLVESAQG